MSRHFRGGYGDNQEGYSAHNQLFGHVVVSLVSRPPGLGLIGIEVFKLRIGQFAAALLVVVFAVATAAVVQSIAVWLTAMLRRD